MAFQINGGSCIGCGACQAVCPAECIAEINDILYVKRKSMYQLPQLLQYLPGKMYCRGRVADFWGKTR